MFGGIRYVDFKRKRWNDATQVEVVIEGLQFKQKRRTARGSVFQQVILPLSEFAVHMFIVQLTLLYGKSDFKTTCMMKVHVWLFDWRARIAVSATHC